MNVKTRKVGKMKFNLHLLRLMVIPCAIIVISMAGCMSLEERLSSSDAGIKKNAEIELYQNAVATRNDAEVMKAVGRITSNEVLARIAVHSEMNIALKAVERMSEDPWLYGVASSARHMEVKSDAASKIKSQKWLVELYNDLYIKYDEHEERDRNGQAAKFKEIMKLRPYTTWDKEKQERFRRSYFGKYLTSLEVLKFCKEYGFDEREVEWARSNRLKLLNVVQRQMDYEALIKVNAPLGIHHVKFWRQINAQEQLRKIFYMAGWLPVEEQVGFAKKIVSDKNVPTELVTPPDKYLKVLYTTPYLEDGYSRKKRREDEYYAQKLANELALEQKRLENTGLSEDAVKRNLDKKRNELENYYEGRKSQPSKRLADYRKEFAQITKGSTNNVITIRSRGDDFETGYYVVNYELRNILLNAIKEAYSLSDRCAAVNAMVEKQDLRGWLKLRDSSNSTNMLLAAAMFTKDCIMPSMANASNAERKSFEQLLNCVFKKVDDCQKEAKTEQSFFGDFLRQRSVAGLLVGRQMDEDPNNVESLEVTLAAWADTLGEQNVVEYLDSRERDPISVLTISILIRNCVKNREYALRLFKRFGNAPDIRWVLAWRLAPEDITAELLAGESDTQVRKILTDRAPKSLVEELRKSNAAFAKEMIEQGKADPRHVLGGFYLGMSLSKARALLEIQFPEMKFHETEDGIYFDENLNDNQGFLSASDISNNILKKDASGITMYFCRARNDRVYLFNFNEKLLKKLLNYNAQTYDDWRRQYAMDKKVIWKYYGYLEDTFHYSVTMVSNKGEIYEKSKHPVQTFDWKNPPKEFEVERTLKASQEAWRYINRESQCKTTYFGACPDKEKLCEAGLGSRWINGVGALEGTLRFEDAN